MRAFVFPGQGAQTIGMGREMAEAFPAAMDVFREVDETLGENLKALMDAINKAKPSTAKGIYVRSLYISSTMGPSIKLNPMKF